MKYTKFTMAALLSVVLFAFGCQNEENSEEDTSSEESEAVTLEDDAGNEVEIPENPERIIGSYLEDDLLTLDEKPVVQWSVNDGASIQDYLQDEGLEGLETIPHDLPYEVVASHEPDLILTSSSEFAEGESYDNYSSIAPTFVVESGNYDDWRDRLNRVAEVFGKEDLAEEKIAEYEDLSGSVQDSLPEDESAMAIWQTGDTYFVSNADKSSGEVLYHDLGLQAPSFVEELSADNETPWLEVSLETLAESDVDHIFFIGENEGDAETAFEDDVFQNIPAVENGNVHEYLGDSSWLYSGYIANSQIVEDVKTAFEEE
jgi:iron complex transport system substrate-binding protein